jgi:WD40 repeat protein
LRFKFYGDIDFIVWDIAKSQEIGRIPAKGNIGVRATVSADRRRIAFLAYDESGERAVVRVWDVERMEEIASWTPKPFAPHHKLEFSKAKPWVKRIETLHEVNAMALSPDGRHVLTQEAIRFGITGESSGVLRLWKLP